MSVLNRMRHKRECGVNTSENNEKKFHHGDKIIRNAPDDLLIQEYDSHSILCYFVLFFRKYL